MTHSKQAAKRVRQNEQRRQRNKATLSIVRTLMKRVLTACESGDKATAQSALSLTLSRIDKAAKHNVIHANTAARKKGRLMRALAKLG